MPPHFDTAISLRHYFAFAFSSFRFRRHYFASLITPPLLSIFFERHYDTPPLRFSPLSLAVITLLSPLAIIEGFSSLD